MSNSSEFLKNLVEAGKALSGGGGGIVSRVKVEFGFHQYVSGHDYWSFFKPVESQEAMADVKAELVGRLQKAGCGDTPNFGVKVTIDKNVLSRDKPYKTDLQKFIPTWQEDAFQLIYDAIESADLPIGKWFYGRVEYKANPYNVKQGEAGKTDEDQNGKPCFPTIRVPTEKFADETAAKAAVTNKGSGSSVSSDNSQWSQTAIESYGPDMSGLEKQTDEILKWLDEAKKGNAFNNDADNFPLPTPPTPPNLKKYIAEIYAIESSDVDLLIPF